MTSYFGKKIALFQSEVKSQKEALSIIATCLYQTGLVKDSFAENVLKREEVFPTGLLINDVGIAIPHTDAEHVNDSQIAFMSLKKPVTFYEMGTADKEISVSLIFMLALKEPHAQLEMLQTLITMFQKKEVVQKLQAVNNTEEYYQIIEKEGFV